MNDRFRFRVWDKSFCRMIYNIFFFWKENTITVYELHKDASKSYLPNSHIVLEQCTGLKDKNGTLIYEGDIIRLPWQAGWPDLIGVVKFNELYACFLLSKTITDRAEQSFWWNDSKEVIGNIHENPELLEVEK